MDLMNIFQLLSSMNMQGAKQNSDSSNGAQQTPPSYPSDFESSASSQNSNNTYSQQNSMNNPLGMLLGGMGANNQNFAQNTQTSSNENPMNPFAMLLGSMNGNNQNPTEMLSGLLGNGNPQMANILNMIPKNMLSNKKTGVTAKNEKTNTSEKKTIIDSYVKVDDYYDKK